MQKCSDVFSLNYGPKYKKSIGLAIDKIIDVIIDGGKKHSKDDWKTRCHYNDHLFHASNHLYELDFRSKQSTFEKPITTADIEALSHAATRCIMALEIMLEKYHEDELTGNY